MENREGEVIQEMRKLIALSCCFDGQPENKFFTFHKLFLKFFFNAKAVEIDYKTQVISIWNCKPLTTDPVRLFDLDQAVADKVCYTDLEETLAGCLGEGHVQINFYKKVVSQYEDDLNSDNKGFLSA